MQNSLSISNFDKERVFRFLKLNRAFFMFVALFCVTGVLFIAISYFSLEGTEQIVRIKRDWVRQKDAFKEVPGKSTVIFLGNSKVGAGIIPELFDQATGYKTHSFNLALPALPLAPHYFLLKDYLKNNKPPQYIVMTLTPGRFDGKLFPFYAIQGAGLWEVCCYTFIVKNIDILMNYVLPWRYYFPEVKLYFKEKILSFMPEKDRERFKKEYIANLMSQETYHHYWSNIFDSIYMNLEQTAINREKVLKKDRGYYFIIEQAAVGWSLPDDYIAKLKVNTERQNQIIAEHAKMDDPFVDKFFSLTRAHGIKVILVSDYAIINQLDQIESVPSYWKYIQSRYDNVYFSKNGFRKQFYEPKYFSDPVHVNPQGAIKYTKKIAQVFNLVIAGIK